MENKKHQSTYILRVTLLVVMLPSLANSYGQDSTRYISDGSEGEMFAVFDNTSVKEKKDKKSWNTFNLGFTTLKIGAGLLIDYAAYSQDEEGKEQMDLAKVEPKAGFKVRDTRIMFSGKFNTRRTITWKAGFMFDGQSDLWSFRETGIMVGVPELWGSFFIGRTKEGVSMSKVMNGYAGEMIERHAALDPIPLLADGIKWLGYVPKQRIFGI